MDEENFETLTMECNNCHLPFRAGELRIDPVNHYLVCSNCLVMPGSKISIIRDPTRRVKPSADKKYVPYNPAKIQTDKPFPVPKSFAPKKEVVRNVGREAPNVSLTASAEFKSLQCDHCHYRFNRRVSWKGNCPYCSKNTVRVLRQQG